VCYEDLQHIVAKGENIDNIDGGFNEIGRTDAT